MQLQPWLDQSRKHFGDRVPTRQELEDFLVSLAVDGGILIGLAALILQLISIPPQQCPKCPAAIVSTQRKGDVFEFACANGHIWTRKAERV